MEEKIFEGKIDKWAIQPKRSGDGEFLKLQIDGKFFNFFDIGFFEDNKDKFKVNSEVKVIYFDSPWSDPSGKPMTSHTIQTVEFKQTASATAVKPLQEFQKATELKPVEENDIETMMEKCIQIARKLTEEHHIPLSDTNGKYVPFFTSDNVTSICNTLFIESSKRCR